MLTDFAGCGTAEFPTAWRFRTIAAVSREAASATPDAAAILLIDFMRRPTSRADCRSSQETLANEHFHATVRGACDIVRGMLLALSFASPDRADHPPVAALGRKPVHDFLRSFPRKDIIVRIASDRVGMPCDLY